MDTHPDPEGWERLSELAHWGLEHPDQSSPPRDPPDLALQMRLWSYPRWGPHVSWGLFLPLWHEGEALVRESRWNAPSDRRRLSSSLASLKMRHRETPTLRSRDAVVDTGRLAPFLLEAPEALSDWASRGPRDAGSEKATSGLEGFRSLTHARVEWTEGEEAAAEGIVAWALRLRELLRASLRDRETV